MNSFFDNIYSDIYKLGCGYKKAFCAVGRAFSVFFVKAGKAIAHFFVTVFTFVSGFVRKYASAVWDECKRFAGEVKRAVPVLKADFRANPARAFAHFIKYVFRSFTVHEKFARAVLSTVIPLVALVYLLSFSAAYGSLTFALEVFVEGESVGVVKDETAYKDAEKQAKKRFATIGSEMAAVIPEYRVTVTTVNKLDSGEAVCNNIISAVSESTVDACGIYADGEFLFAVGSEDTFNRVRDRVFDEYAAEYGYTASDCKLDFTVEITTETGVYPDNDKILSADELYEYMNGYSDDRIEHTVKPGERLRDILTMYSVTEEELLSNNPDLDKRNVPEGAVLLIEKGERNMSISATVTYIRAETIPFDTVTQYDNNIFMGTTMTVVSGMNGQDLVSYTDTYIDGVKVDSAREILRYNAAMPVNQLIKIGTMGIPVDSNGNAVSPRLTRDRGGSFVWPAPDNCFWLSQGYNPYNSHYGIDIVSSDDGSCRGRRIVAVADGIVTMATYHWSWGYYIRIDHGSGVVTGYAHALRDSFRVSVGDYVRAGQHISSIGTTGNSTGYHLHFEVWLDGVRVNPLPYVYSEYTGIAIKYY